MMSIQLFKRTSLAAILVFLFGCKQQYIPPVAKTNLGYLVVDGTILNGPDPTVINLSRTQNLTDSIYQQNPETGAQVSLTGNSGSLFSLADMGNGTYRIDQLNLNAGEAYQLKILTANGEQYLSDTLSVKPDPPIDSVSWKFLPDRIQIYVNTHDPLNNTRYYRWDYSETWEYHSAYDPYLIYDNGTILNRNADQRVYTCWRTGLSNGLLLGSTANLSQDVIFEKPVTYIPLGDQKVSVEYSILVKQYALSRQAFEYWQSLQKSTEQTGSFFDPQPSQLSGNIHSTINPNEPVLGYIEISGEQQQRIFISNKELPSWPYRPPSLDCSQFVVPHDSADYYFQRGFMPIDYTFPASIGFISSTAYCADCTVQGGTNVKPAYWPF